MVSFSFFLTKRKVTFYIFDTISMSCFLFSINVKDCIKMIILFFCIHNLVIDL